MRGRIGLTALTGGLIVLIGLMLAACGSVIDADQARLCRAIPEALNPEGAQITEVSLTPIPDRPASLRMSYRVRVGHVTLPRFIICHFAGQAGTARFELTGVDTDRGRMSGIKLLILKRWWLASARPAPAAEPLVSVEARTAYWLQQALNGVVLAGIYGLLGTGFALVYGLMGQLNLAFGSIAVVGGVNMLVVTGIASLTGKLSGTSLTLSLICGIFGAAMLSWLVGRIVMIPIATASRSPQPALIGAVAAGIVITEAVRITSTDRLNYMPALLNRPIHLAGGSDFIATITPGRMLAAGLGLTCAALLLGLIVFSSFGRVWRAHSDDPQMTEILGFSVRRLRSVTFVIAGAAAGVAGSVMVIAYGTVQAQDGLALTLKALISAIIGGIGSVPGAFAGAMLVAFVETVWSSTFDIAYRDVVIYALLAAFLILRPGGLFPRSALPPREF